MTDQEWESFVVSADVWASLIIDRDPLDGEWEAKRFAACLLLARLTDVLLSTPRREFNMTSALAKIIARSR